YRLSGNRDCWNLTRSIARGNELGDIGERPGAAIEWNHATTCSDPNALLALLELHEKDHAPAFLDLARHIGSNMLAKRFHKGFFVTCADCVYAKFDALEPLALLRLAAVIQGKPDLVPRIWPGKSYFHCTYDGLGRTYDNAAIYTQRRR